MKEEILEAVEKSIIYLTNELLEALVIEEAIERGGNNAAGNSKIL